MAAQFDLNSPLSPKGQWVEVKRSSHTSIIKANGLYSLLETLIKENHLIATRNAFSKHKIKNENGYYYLSKFPENPTEELFEDYTCVERHLRIDEDYSDSKNYPGLSPAHFSEYWIRQTNERIIVHVYYLDRIQTVQAKTDAGVSIPLTEQLIQKIKRNTASGFMLYRELLEERDRRLKKAIEGSDSLLESLTTLSIDLSSAQNQEEYLNLGRKFVKMIEGINQYAGGDFPRDKRGDFIAARIAQIEDFQQTIAPSALQEITAELTLEEESTLPILAMSIKKPSKSQLKLQEIGELIERLERQKSHGWTVDSYQIANRLKIELFDLAFSNAPYQLGKPLVKKARKILAALPDPCMLAVNVASAGKLEDFKILLAMLNPNNACAVYIELFKKLWIAETDENQEAINLRKICEYLFENNKLYRVMIRIPFLMAISKTAGTSLLYHTFVLQKLLTFRMMLRHGCDPNEIGYKEGDRCYSLLKAMVLYNSSKMIMKDYIDCLFDHGLELDVFHPTNREISDSIPVDSLYQHIDSQNTSRRNKNLSLLTKDIINLADNHSLFDLVFSIDNQSFGTAQLLIPHSHLAAISLGLASLANMRDYFAKGQAIAATAIGRGVLLFPSMEDRQIALFFESIENNSNDIISLRYFIARNTASKEAYQRMEQLYQAFISEYQKCSKREIVGHISLLRSLASVNSRVPTYQARFYNACLILLVHKGKLDLTERQQVLDLLYRSAICCAISGKAEFQTASTLIYQDIISFAEKSPETEILKSTPAYRAAVKALSKQIPLLYQQGTAATSSTSPQQHKPSSGSRIAKEH